MKEENISRSFWNNVIHELYYMNERDDEHYEDKNLNHSEDTDIDKYYINR